MKIKRLNRREKLDLKGLCSFFHWFLFPFLSRQHTKYRAICCWSFYFSSAAATILLGSWAKVCWEKRGDSALKLRFLPLSFGWHYLFCFMTFHIHLVWKGYYFKSWCFFFSTFLSIWSFNLLLGFQAFKKENNKKSWKFQLFYLFSFSRFTSISVFKSTCLLTEIGSYG